MRLLGPDGKHVTNPLAAVVTIKAIDSCADVSCQVPSEEFTPGNTFGRGTVRLLMETDGHDTLTLYLGIPGMPVETFKVGETYDATVAAGLDTIFFPTLDQTVTLSRGGQIVAFASDLRAFHAPLLPAVPVASLTIADGGVTCEAKDAGFGGCGVKTRAFEVTTAKSHGVVSPGETVTIEPFSVTSGLSVEYIDNGSCDAKSATRLAAFALSR